MEQNEDFIKPSEENDRVVEYAGLKFLLIYNTDSLKTDEIVFYDAVIIQAGDYEFTRQIIKRIRGHFNHEHYLKPLYLLKGSMVKDPFYNLIDGVLYNLEQIKLIVSNIQNILLRKEDLVFTKSLSFEAQVIQKTLCYMYTREINELSPAADINSGVGYTYPIISVNYSHYEEYQMLEVINLMIKEIIVKNTFNDAVYLCSKCSSGYLSFREVCPRCNSSHSKTQDIVHHFPCSYVGPMEDFKIKVDDSLMCPKCNKTLRHIGVDYDKPSIINDCLSCGNRYQDFNVKAKCLACSFDNEVEQLKKKEIYNLQVTKKGELIAINGYVSSSKDLESIRGTVKFDVFRTMLKYEVERIKKSKTNSNLIMLHLENSEQVYSNMEKDMEQDLLKAFVHAIRNNIPTSCVITFHSASTILIIMHDITFEVVKQLTDEIVNFSKELIKNNFPEMDVKIVKNVKPISSKLSSELQIQQIVKDIV